MIDVSIHQNCEACTNNFPFRRNPLRRRHGTIAIPRHYLHNNEDKGFPRKTIKIAMQRPEDSFYRDVDCLSTSFI